MPTIGPPELLIVLAILLLLFGATRLPRLARSIGQSAREFRSGLKEGFEEPPVEGPCPFCGAEVAEDSKFCSGCGKNREEIVAEKERTAQKPT